MEEQPTQPNVEQREQDPTVDDRQPWEQPKLERLHVSLDTALAKGSNIDGFGGSAPPP
jgi:hypothetical protein